MSLFLSFLKHTINNFRAFIKSVRQWRRIIPTIVAPQSDSPHLVIVPCDPWSVGGSRGDEAMITAVIQHCRQQNPDLPVTIVAGSDEGKRYIEALSIPCVGPALLWTGNYPLERIYRGIIQLKPTQVVLLGADCMDGFYSPFISLTLLALHDLLTRTPGVDSRMMGFSFNTHPYPPMKWAFNHLSPDTRLVLRDAISLARFQRFCKAPASLVADSAFMLQPDNDFAEYHDLEQWIAQRRGKGAQRIIGMNFHPMLRKYSGPGDIQQDALVLAHNVEAILNGDRQIAFVLIPHDDRSRLTDNLMLATMADYLRAQGHGDRIYYSGNVPRAPQLKALCSLLDGLVSSRMHLAIAALGQGKSVMVASYQGKFEGLFQHFLLPNDYILPAAAFISDAMVPAFHRYVQHIDTLTRQVEKALPTIVELSNKNLDA